MRFTTTLGLTVALLAATTAVAKDTPQSVLDDAKVLANRGEAMKAADRYGDAVALAQAAGDLQAEQAVADSLEGFIEDATRDAGRAKAEGGKTSDVPSAAALLAAVLRKLDPNRCGAFVSAPVLARNVLLLATETGEFVGVADASRVSAAHAAKATSGRAAAVVAKYAEGLKAVADGKFDAATAPLESAAADAVKAGWFDLAAHATTELAAAWVRLGAPDKAVAAISATAGGLDATSGVECVGSWIQMVSTRIPDPAAARKPVEELMARQNQQGPGGEGTPGSRGANAGEVMISDVAKLLPRHAKGKPFVAATRSGKAVEIRWVTKPTEKTVVPFGVDAVALKQEGGVTLAFFGPSIALRMVDLVNNTGGGLGGKRTPGAVRAFYLLAEGETWNASKDGVVTITR